MSQAADSGANLEDREIVKGIITSARQNFEDQEAIAEMFEAGEAAEFDYGEKGSGTEGGLGAKRREYNTGNGKKTGASTINRGYKRWQESGKSGKLAPLGRVAAKGVPALAALITISEQVVTADSLGEGVEDGIMQTLTEPGEAILDLAVPNFQEGSSATKSHNRKIDEAYKSIDR